MAITCSKAGVWVLDDAYKKIASDYWAYNIFQDPGSYLLSWGNNSIGRLGINNSIYYSSPVQVPGSNWANLYENNTTRYLLKQDNTLYVTGRNFKGAFGLNISTDCCASSPIQIPGTTWSILPKNSSVIGGVAGAIKTDGTLWAWGQNEFGLLGDNTQTHRSSPVQIPGTTWCRLTFGSHHGLALKTDCTLWSWGRNVAGQLGTSTSYSVYTSSPVQIPGSTWCNISSNGQFNTAIKTDGTLWSWGYNGNGELGDNTKVSRSSPVQIPGTSWCDSITGYAHSLAIKTGNTLWAWGFNGIGALGNDSITSASSPIQIPGTWCRVGGAMGIGSSGALRTNNSAFVWGHGAGGVLNNNSIQNRSSPIQIPGTWNNIKGGSYNFSVFRCST